MTKSSSNTKRERLLGIGARISGLNCLDFVNTVNWHGSKNPAKWRDRFHEYEDVIWWAHYGGILSKRQLKLFLAAGSGDCDNTQQALEAARAFREIFYRIILDTLNVDSMQKIDLQNFNLWFKRAITNGTMVCTDNQFRLTWEYDYRDLIAPLYPVIYDAFQLLLSGQLLQVGICSTNGCGWLFLDKSKNHSRRWCCMQVCGSRAKARDYYYRQKANLNKEKQ